MTTFSLDRAPPEVAPRTRGPSWFARIIAAVQESRMRSAQAVIARYRGFMPIPTERWGDDTPRRVARGRPAPETKRPGP